MEMKTVHIGDLGEIITGSTPSKKNPDNYGDFALWIKPTDMDENNKYTRETEEMFSERSAEACRSRLIPKDSILVPCIGTVGTKLTMSPIDCFTNQSVNAIVPNEDYDNHYVYYLIRNFLPALKGYNKGTASGREYIAKSAFENIEICVHEDLAIQHKIGKILSTYDDLIENCRKQIALLEEVARRLYHEWFVDFRFPGYETATFNEDGLPYDWHTSNVNEMLTFHRGYDLTKKQFVDGIYPIVGSSSIIGYHNHYKINGPGIVTGRSGSLGTIQFIFDNFWPHNTSLYLSNTKGHSIYFLHQMLILLDFSTLNNGGAIPTLNRNTLSNIAVIKPSHIVEMQFHERVSPYYILLNNLRRLVSTLTEARDRLLPKLMSGEINVE
jgi:Restriction endonuclease S subunits